MVASQWWPAAPTLEEWNVLRRGAGLSGEAVLPLTEMAPLLTVPWTRRQAEALNDLAARYRKSLLAFAVGLAVAVLATPLAASLRLLVKTAMLERVIQQQSVTVGATLKAREAAERDLGAVEQLLRLRPPQRQLRLLSVVVAKTPGTWKLLEWRMPDPRTLEVVMQMASPNPTALVRGWESSGVFSNVSVDIGRSGDVAIKAAIISVPGSGAGESALP